MADMDNLDDSDSPQSSQQDPGLMALSQAFEGNQYTTPDALNYANKILTRSFSGNQEKSEQAAMDKMTAAAEEAKQILRTARARITASRYQKAIPWLAVSHALSRPTQTGTLSESVGNMSGALLPVLQGQEQFKHQREKELQDVDTGITGIDQQMAQREMALQAMRRKSEGPLNVEALKVLGRTIKGPAKPTVGQISQYGKIARDEGLEEGTTNFNNRVTQLRNEDLKVRQVTAGMDSDVVPPEEKIKAAVQYGMPMPPVDPYHGLSTRGRQQAQQIEQRHANTSLEKAAVGLGDAKQAIMEANRFTNLNKQVNSGYFQGKLPALNAAEQEMDSITAVLSRKVRSPGEGTTSDFDAQQFIKGTLARGKNFEANQNLATGFKASKQLQLDQYAFLQDYMAMHGHLRGADTLWRQYLENNPIFDPSHPGSYKLNQSRVPYQTYFRNQIIAKHPELKDVVFNTQKESAPTGYAEGGLVDEALQGVTSGFSDELTPGDSANPRADMLIQESRHPVESGLARAGGTTALVAAGYQMAKRMGMTDAAIRLMPQSQLLRLALSGATSGLAMGAGRSEGDNQGQQIGMSGLIGTGAGALSGLAAKYGLMEPISMLQNRMSKDPISGADRRVLSAMDKDKMSPADMLTQMKLRQKSKLPVNVVDLVGPHGEALASEAASRTGPGSERLADELSNRQADVRNRIGEHINQALKPDEYFSKEDQLTSDLYKNAKPLYDTAYEAHPVVKSGVFQQLANTPDGKRAIKNAIRIMRNEGKSIGPQDALGMVRSPSLEFLDNVKRGFDDLINGEESPSGIYKATNLGRTMRGMRDKLLTELDTVSPEYKEARDQYAGDLEVRDALRSGRDDFSTFTPEEIRRKINGMSFAEKDAFRSGVAQHLFQKIGQPSSDINPAQNIAGSPDTMTRLQSMFDDPKEYTIFNAALNREARDFKRNKQVLSSASQGRAQSAGASHNLLGVVDESLAPFPLRYGAMNTAMSLMRFRVPMSTKTANAISNVLATSSPAEITKMAKSLEAKSAVLASRKGRAGKVAALGAILGGAAAAPGPKGENLDLSGREMPPSEEP